MIRRALRPALAATVWANARAKLLAIRLTRWTGKSPEYVHPKHLLPESDEHYWYLDHLARGDRVLDVGCGNGLHTLRAAARCAYVAGVDRSEASLAVGRRSARARGIHNAGLCRADVEEGLPVASGRFDTVICLDLLEHVYKRELVLREIRRVLRPGGLLLLAVPNRGTAWKRLLEGAGLFAYSDPDHKVEYLLPELEDELAAGGFRIRARRSSVIDMPLVGLIDVVGGVSLGLYRRLSVLRRRLAARYPTQDAGFCLVCEAA